MDQYAWYLEYLRKLNPGVSDERLWAAIRKMEAQKIAYLEARR